MFLFVACRTVPTHYTYYSTKPSFVQNAGIVLDVSLISPKAMGKKSPALKHQKTTRLCSNVFLISHLLRSVEQVLADIEDGCGKNTG